MHDYTPEYEFDYEYRPFPQEAPGLSDGLLVAALALVTVALVVSAGALLYCWLS
ncbi:hypothetical protein [Hymenobacter sp. BT491]|uniref:hypothetical protein n=1 Tax=Hymenobacter sp. BT491 TaxID=2766779 RepID=UPI001653D136|nr:hypothetical protein [Hymenobacter sp. BT491]MBC6988981.1 hypothetical protein [Hymenobacter sp. BT491]